MDTGDTDRDEEGDANDETAADEIEEFSDNLPRATHSYKKNPDKNANEYEVTKWIPIQF